MDISLFGRVFHAIAAVFFGGVEGTVRMREQVGHWPCGLAAPGNSDAACDRKIMALKMDRTFTKSLAKSLTTLQAEGMFGIAQDDEKLLAAIAAYGIGGADPREQPLS